MSYGKLLNTTFVDFGINPLIQFNAFAGKTAENLHWNLKLPDIDFNKDTLLLIEFQDYVTWNGNVCHELTQVEQHYGDRAGQVVVFHWTHGLDRFYRGPLRLLEFSGHNYRECLELKQKVNQWLPFVQKSKVIAWQSLNGRVVEHRQRVAKILHGWSGGILSLGNDIALPQWGYATYRGTENFDNFLRLNSVYGRCAVNIVTETEYNRAPGILTEKTLYAMAAAQVPIIIGHQGIVRDLAELGFDTFDDLVDTSYDSMPNGVRAEMALSLNMPLILGEIDLTPWQERLSLQQKRILHYTDIMADRLKTDVDRLLRVIF